MSRCAGAHWHTYSLPHRSPASACQLDDRSYIVSFDDEMLARKRAAGDVALFFDGREHSNISRLVNDDTERPKLKLVYSPEADAADGLPRRAFLVAAVDVPAWIELTWDYGRHYERHWLPWWQRRPSSQGNQWNNRWNNFPHDQLPSCLNPPVPRHIRRLQPPIAATESIRKSAPEGGGRRLRQTARKSAPDDWDPHALPSSGELPWAVPTGFAVSEKPTAAMLVPGSIEAKKLVGRIVLYHWVDDGWCEGIIEKANGDKSKTVDGDMINFEIYYERDDNLSRHVLELDSYAPDGPPNSWVLLKAAGVEVVEEVVEVEAQVVKVFDMAHRASDKDTAEENKDEEDEEDEEEEGNLWAVEKIIWSDEGEDEREEDSKPEERTPELWEALDLAGAESRETRRRGLVRIRQLIGEGREALERSAKAVPGSDVSHHVREGWSTALHCEGCEQLRWPEPLFPAAQFPRTANRIRRDAFLRGRLGYAQPRLGGPSEQRRCHCTDEERDAGRLRRAEAVAARDQAARRAAPHGADHLTAAIVDAASGALRGCLARGGVLGDETRLTAAMAGNVLRDVLHGALHCDCQHCTCQHRPGAVAAHLSTATGPLTQLWSMALDELKDDLLDDNPDQSDDDADHAIELREFADRAFESLSLLLATVAPGLDALHWVGHACAQLTGAHLGRDVLSLVAQHLRQPRLDFVAAGGCRVLVSQVQSLADGHGRQHESVSLRTLTPCVRLMATLAEDAAAASNQLVSAEAPDLLAAMMHEKLLAQLHPPFGESSALRKSTCMAALDAISSRGGVNGQHVEWAVAGAQEEAEEEAAEEAKRRMQEDEERRAREAVTAARREREAEARCAREAAEEKRRKLPMLPRGTSGKLPPFASHPSVPSFASSVFASAVACPWPQCKGRTFKRVEDHKAHCNAKHGGLLAPSDMPVAAQPPLPLSTGPLPLPDGWVEAPRTDGEPYWYHRVTRETTWTRPVGKPVGYVPVGWPPALRLWAEKSLAECKNDAERLAAETYFKEYSVEILEIHLQEPRWH